LSWLFFSCEERFIIELSAILGFDGSVVVGTDVLQEVVLNSVLDIIRVDSSGNNPWDIGVSWGEGLGSLSNNVLVLDGILTFVASDNIIDVVNFDGGTASVGNLFVVGSLIGLFNAVDELK